MDGPHEPEHPHSRANRISLALHRAVAARVRAQPELVEEARERLERWVDERGYPLAYARRWRALLAGPREALLELICRDDEESRSLRQNTPFAGVVPPRERWAMVRAARAGGLVGSQGEETR